MQKYLFTFEMQIKLSRRIEEAVDVLFYVKLKKVQ